MSLLAPPPWENVGPAAKKPFGQAALLVDLRRCVGCHACSVSCKTENNVPLGDFRIRVRYLERPPEQNRPTLAFAPMLCMHCQDAPCLNACPSNAISRLDDGRVVVNQNKCDTEQECVTACPYGAIYVNEETGKADKCDLCAQRTENGLDPACAEVCPTDAIKYHDLSNEEDPVTKVARLQAAKAWKEGEKTMPSVLYIEHETWMEEAANTGVSLDPADRDITYEQNNLKG